MTQKRKSKKILLASELLLLEEYDIIEQDRKYAAEFSSDFSDELRFLDFMGKTEEKFADAAVVFEVPKKTLKRIHRKLALSTHPDHNNNSKKFNDVQEAYESGDASKMIAIAREIGLDISLTKEEIEHLEIQIESKKKTLNNIKLRVRWAWCKSDKSKKLRKQVRKIMGILQKDWDAWKKS